MNKNKQLNDILDTCLERMRQGGSIEQCLAAYPGQAQELRPLLETAAMVKQAAAVTPRADLKAQLQYRLHAAAQEKPQRSHPLFGWSRQWATGVSVALVVLMAGGSTVAASASAMPDSTLYPVKQATEQVRMKLTFSDVSKAELYAQLAGERMNELDYLTAKSKVDNSDRTEKTEQVRRQLNTALDKVVVLAAPPPQPAAGIMMAPPATPPEAKSGSASGTKEDPKEDRSNGKEDDDTRDTPPAAAMPAVRPEPAPETTAMTFATAAPDPKKVQLQERATEFKSKRDALEKARDHAPNERAKQAIEQALKVSEKGYGKALDEIREHDDKEESRK